MKFAISIFALFIAAAGFAQTAENDYRPDCTQRDANGKPLADCRDTRDPFIASAYIGEAIDNFAGDPTLQYLNPGDANSSRSRAVAGVDFEYRLIGKPGADHQFWIYGETVQGVSSKDVDCKNPNTVKLSVCTNNFSSGTDVQTVLNGAPDQFIAILRNASSLEAFLGGRYEFKEVQPSTTSAAHLFVKAQLGFLAVSNSGGNVVAHHQLSVGALTVNGIFQDSYLELGIGKDDLFQHHRNRRLIIDGYLSVDPHYIPMIDRIATNPYSRITPFVQFYGNLDPGSSGSSAIQTYFGLNFNFGYKRTPGASSK